VKNEYYHLAKIIDLPKWQKLQESLSTVTQLAILTVDYKGIPFTEHSQCRSFCQLMRSDPTLAKNCQKCDARGGLEAVRLNEPYIYLCHANIIDLAIPIIIDNKYIGAIMAGQVKLSNPEAAQELEYMNTGSGKAHLASKWAELSEPYAAIPALSYGEIRAAADMLFNLCHYMVEEAMNKNLILELYERLLPPNGSAGISASLPGYTLQNIESAKRDISNTLTSAYLTQSESAPPIHPVLKPAIDYLYEHKQRNASMKEMAELCHISPSYFSRLFQKETGQSFSAYKSSLKLEWAKQLLLKSDMPISLISEELGFSEAGFFIKTFKKAEGVTPALYRKYYREQS
jgi:ligand-binding sensor protein/AraC-like DNA-binding protein